MARAFAPSFRAAATVPSWLPPSATMSSKRAGLAELRMEAVTLASSFCSAVQAVGR